MERYVKDFNQFVNENVTDYLIVYHGTKYKFVSDIESDGLKDKNGYNQGWYMVSTDFESALFHAHSDDNQDFVYVFEFRIPITSNDYWYGYPYLWKGTKIKDGSTWFALKKEIPKEFITKLHKVTYDEWISQKNSGF